MKKTNNRFLTTFRTFFAGDDGGAWWLWNDSGNVKRLIQDLNVTTVLEAVAQTPDIGEKPCRVFVNVSRDYLQREWFDEAIMGGWELVSYNHDARTGRFVRNHLGKRDITVSMLANWVNDPDTARAARTYSQAQEFFKAKFGFGFLGSATMTGLYALEQTLPSSLKSFDEPEMQQTLPSDSFLETLHKFTTQGRSEMFLPSSPRAFYYYDRRFAYAADCRLEMPCGRDFYHKGRDAKYVMYEPAFYRVRFEVPGNWVHVGLLPVLTGDGWRWPSEGSHVSFVAEPELRLAVANGWRIEELEAWRFGKARPMERWRNLLVEEWKGANAAGAKEQANIFRHILLHGIGGLYARSFTREKVVGASDLGELKDAERLSAEAVEGGFRVESRVARTNRFYAPHWAAYTWARARAILASRMLTLPVTSLLGCHVDAIYSSSPLGGIGDEVGQFRLKGSLSFDSPQRLDSPRKLLGMRAASEGGQV